MGCLFCDIIAGTAAASMAYADDGCVAFMDLFPINPGHTLVVPREHAMGLEDLTVDTGAALWKVAHHIARGLRRSSFRCEGINLLLADGEAAWQEVFHVHLHVIPRFSSDRFTIGADRYERDRPELDRAAGTLRAGMRQLA